MKSVYLHISETAEMWNPRCCIIAFNMKRKIYDRLLTWKNEANGDSALMIEGVRRVGKSYIVEELF